jgi:hypothetical protein
VIYTTSYFDQLVQSVLPENIGSGGFSGPLYARNIALFNTQVQPSKQQTFAQLTECLFTGYARKAAVAFGAPILQNDFSYTILSALMTFTGTASSAFVPDNVWGWAMIDGSAVPNLLMMELFAAPIPIAQAGDGFGLVIEWNAFQLNPSSQGVVLA